MRTHAFNKHRCWSRSGMNPHEPTSSRVKSALFVNIMRIRNKQIISCAVPRTWLTELSSSKVIWTTKAFYSQQVARRHDLPTEGSSPDSWLGYVLCGCSSLYVDPKVISNVETFLYLTDSTRRASHNVHQVAYWARANFQRQTDWVS